uniref:hypothetical protein n=1 Tax=Salinibacterium sp. TaxID=1915057 RepID=UPI00286C5676
MTEIQLTHDLSTVEGFARRVVIDRTPRNIALVLVLLSIAAIAYNTVSTLRTLSDFGGQASDFLTVFFSVEGDSPLSSFMFIVIVWAPLFLLPASLAFFLYSRATASKVAAKTFQEFQANGYLAIQAPTSLIVSPNNDRNTMPVVLVSHPSVPDGEFAASLAAIEAQLASLDKKAVKALGRSVVKAGVNFGTSATAFNSLLPAALMVTVPRKGSSNVVVIPPAGAPATSAKTRILG